MEKSKHQILNQEELVKFKPNPEFIRYIEKARETFGIPKNEMKILDWGCGRGRLVAWLRREGYLAYGVDVDQGPIENSKAIFKHFGFNENEPLLSLIAKEKTNFADNYFHMVVSDNVMEHIANLSAVAQEINRITLPNGFGFHLFPAAKTWQEGHLFMPLVHWLPKNRIRKSVIAFWVLIGREPNWPELSDLNFSEKVTRYFEYSRDKTYYRSLRKLRKIWADNGFKLNFVAIDHPRLRKLASLPMFRRLMNLLLSVGVVVEIQTIKNSV